MGRWRWATAAGRSWIRALRPAREEFIAALEGVGDRGAAEALKGSMLYVARDRLPPPGEDEVYLSDVIGLPVYRKDGNLLGVVAAIADYGAGDLLEIRRMTGAAPY